MDDVGKNVDLDNSEAGELRGIGDTTEDRERLPLGSVHADDNGILEG